MLGSSPESRRFPRCSDKLSRGLCTTLKWPSQFFAQTQSNRWHRGFAGTAQALAAPSAFPWLMATLLSVWCRWQKSCSQSHPHSDPKVRKRSCINGMKWNEITWIFKAGRAPSATKALKQPSPSICEWQCPQLCPRTSVFGLPPENAKPFSCLRKRVLVT